MRNEPVYAKRISNVRKLLKQKKLNALIITSGANVTYISGFLGDDSWALITNNSVYLLTDNRYTEQAKKQCRGCKIIERKGPIAKAVAEILLKTKGKKAIALENSTTIEQLVQLKKHIKMPVKSVSGIVESLRRAKDNTEINKIKAVIKIAAKALKNTLRKIKAGITESELAGQIDLQIRKLGAQNSFETIVAFGANAAEPHHICGSRRLKKNDTVLIDFGARLNGYCSDLTRCFTVGRINTRYAKAYEAVEQAQKAAIEKIKAGVDAREVDEAARKVIRRYGFKPHGHGTGHGLGLQVHEQPAVSDKTIAELKASDVITIEPAIYIPGKFGIRLEEDVLVTKSGCKVLSRIRF